jgi:hypothetical protein
MHHLKLKKFGKEMKNRQDLSVEVLAKAGFVDAADAEGRRNC